LSHSGADTPVLATAFAPPASFNFTMNQFDARQRYVEDVVAPPTLRAVLRNSAFVSECYSCALRCVDVI
ncbi:hypothetical protein, partial [Pseudomonas viridiflava]|uniref:hypothetical protein n=1 Tax=Pseudomonas viridiflava TaxID=33069 RepID=UPI00197D98B8